MNVLSADRNFCSADLWKLSNSCLSANIVGRCSLLVRITSSHTRLATKNRCSVLLLSRWSSKDFCRVPCEALRTSISFCCLTTVECGRRCALNYVRAFRLRTHGYRHVRLLLLVMRPQDFQDLDITDYRDKDNVGLLNKFRLGSYGTVGIYAT